MIDLHTHTNASDGAHAPAELVSLAKAAGITVLGLTDHDTVDGLADAASAAAAAGLAFVPGIEITAVWEEREVHVLAYFIDGRSTRLAAFLREARADRERRARIIGGRLAALGVPVDIERLIAAARGRPVQRPAIAQALLDAGHVADRQDAFERYLADDRPAFVPRASATPSEVAALISAEGGIVSLAHPGVTGCDAIIPALAAAGFAALEAAHTDHPPDVEARYRATARAHGLGVTGGSDFHGIGTHHPDLGTVGLPLADLADVYRRAGRPVPPQAAP